MLWFNFILGSVLCVDVDKSFIEKKKHLAVRRLNYVYNIQVIVKMDLKNYNNKNVQI